MARSRPAFTCDRMLGRLAKSLRMLGFDALYARDAGLQALVLQAAGQQRTLLTRRSALLKQKPGSASPHVFIRSNDPHEQLREVLAACDLTAADMAPFSRCLRCNAPLAPLPRREAVGRVPDYVLSTALRFSACPRCGRVYWRGTHYQAMRRRLTGAGLLQGA